MPWGEVDRSESQPFLRYRRRLFSHAVALAGGMSDAAYCDIVRELDAGVARVDGQGFTATPLVQEAELADALGLRGAALLVKDETGNVSGSHKGRHLFGVMLFLRVRERLLGAGPPDSAPLAIASCGNAALAAAVVARAANRALRVFIPTSADPVVVERLQALGAALNVCERRAGEAGDPCYLRFREAVSAGAVPFCCQGPDNGLTIEGGKTLAYELLESAGAAGVDRVFLQVGGGAFASSFVQACDEARRVAVLPKWPAIHAVQTSGAYPLRKAYDAAVRQLVPPGSDEAAAESDAARLAHRVLSSSDPVTRARVLGEAARHRRHYMRPWEGEPRSIAHGILDDETYDWLEIVRALLDSGGWPVVVGEGDLVEANDAALEHTASNVDHTGSAGLAGLVRALRTGQLAAKDLRRERLALVFSGVRRRP